MGEEEFQLIGRLPVGKNFRARNVKANRAGDLYETPYSMTDQLLDVEWFGDKETLICEPASGNGAIERVLRRRGFQVIAKDVRAGEDFLTSREVSSYMVTNPPYSLALEFVLKAKRLCGSKFAFLLPLTYLHGTDRFVNLFRQDQGGFPLARVWVFTRAPDLRGAIREDGKYTTGAVVYAWFIWDRHHRGPPELGWIDNQRFVLRAGE